MKALRRRYRRYVLFLLYMQGTRPIRDVWSSTENTYYIWLDLQTGDVSTRDMGVGALNPGRKHEH